MSNPRVHNAMELEALVQQMGFLPFFACSVPNYSIEEFTPSRYWFVEGVDGPWEWRMEVARRGMMAYGQLLSQKAGLVSREWYPDLANFRRNGYDFDSRYEEGLASYREKCIMDVLLREGPTLSKDLKRMEKYDEGEDPHIEITYWVEKGSRWLQITDNGAGMDKNIIQKYFLKVGVSFYNSTEFIETLKKKSSHFTSIGRFGIGILSCFMVSNHVEVATRSRKITGNDDALYHLQMLNTSDKYTLRRDHDILSFPNKESLDIFDDGYGTSVVLKLRPDIGFSDETILDCLQEFVFLPGINIDYHYLDRAECMWDEKTLLGFEEKRVPYQLAYAESENVIRYYNGPYLADDLNLSPIHIFFEVLSLDIGKHCSDPGINGYLYVTLIYDETMTEREQVLDEYSGFTFHCDNNRVMLMKNQQTLASISFPDADFLGVDFGQIKVYFNGVLHTTAHIQGRPFYNICGKLSLSSDNRPDVHVSRDGSAAFSLRALSMLNYAFRSAVRSLTKKNRHFRHIYDTITLPPILCSLDKIPSCSTIMGVDGIEELWLDERIIPTSLGRMSISEIQKYVSDYGEIQLMNIFYSKHIVSIIGTWYVFFPAMWQSSLYSEIGESSISKSEVDCGIEKDAAAHG